MAYLELVGGAVGNVRVDALLGLTLEEVGGFAGFAAGADVASCEGDFGDEPELRGMLVLVRVRREGGVCLLHFGGVCDGHELRVAGASDGGSVNELACFDGIGIEGMSGRAYARFAGQMTGQSKSMLRVTSLRLVSTKVSDPLNAA